MELRGTDNADSLVGGADNDTIYGFGGNDTLKGGAGDDVLAGNDGADILQGGDGDDYLLGGAGNDTLDGGLGNDWAAYEDATAGVTIDLNKTTAQATGGSGSDKLTSIENVYGSAFNDTLTGNAEANMLVGGAGNDIVSGGKGDDTLWGSEGADTLDGGDGDDYIVGGAGADIIKGGAGWDWSSYEDATAGVTVDLNKTTAQETGGAGIDTVTGVEHLYGSAFNDTLTGDAKDNYLWGDAGDDKLVGGAGDDHLSGGTGVNIIDGGDGWDTVDYAFSNVGVSINLSGAPAPQVSIPPSVDTLISIEAAMGSAYNDYIVGNDAENYLFGDAGNDVLYGIGGHDTLDGGDGNDILRGSFRKPGDLMLGGDGNDQIIVWTGQGSEGDATIVDGGSGVDALMFSSYYDITLDLTKTGDQLISPGVHMVVTNVENVSGSYGNDRLTGDAGNNVINGEQGDDVLDGGAGFDIASYEGDKSVRVDLSKTGPQDTRGAGIDTLSNFEGLKGSLRADILIGDAKDNTFEGGSGDDIIDGGAGTDTAIFLGSSTEYAWTLNANGTWTVKGIDGVDTLLNVEKLQFSDKTVTLSPSATTVTVDDLMGSQVLVTDVGGVHDALLSANGRMAFVATGDGRVLTVDTITGRTVSSIQVGKDLGGMDISTDGRYLVATERQVENATGESWDYRATIKVHVLDLQTGAVRDYATTAKGYDRGFTDAAFAIDGKILLTQSFAGSGFTSITTLDPATGVFSESVKEYGQSGVLSVTDDHGKVLLAPTNGSFGSLFLLNAAGTETASHNALGYFDGVSGFNFGIQAISGDGSKVAQGIYPSSIHVYDGAMKYLVNLAGYTQYSMNVHGMDFSADGQHLYIVDAVRDQIFDFSTASWTLQEVYAIGADINASTPDFLGGAAYGDRVTLSNDGQRMIIVDNDKVVAVNMTGLKLSGGTDGANVLQGTNGHDYLRGFGGDDTLAGGDGADTLVGGLGGDKLSGGEGGDTFVFAKGDSTWQMFADGALDVITDWDASDHLSFGAHSEYIHYGEATAVNLLAAKTIAPQIMGSQHLSYLAIQVEGDVYVFAAPSGSTDGSSETIVKLANTTLDKVSIDNFLPVGDDNANLLIGGALNDTLSGGGGADVIRGGAGEDTLSGGAGADVFQFWAGQGAYNMYFSQVDRVMDFGAGDKLAFEGAPATVTAADINNLGNFGEMSSLVMVTVDAYANGYLNGQYSQKYLVFGAGSDAYVVADTDGVRGYDQVVVLKNFSSTLVTADIFAGG